MKKQNIKIHRNIGVMKWFNFFSDFRPYSPIAVLYFAQVTGSLASALLIFSIFSISVSIFEIPTGIFSDRIGRKKTLMLGALASVFSILCYAIGGSFWVLALGSIFAGLQDAFFSGNNDALVYDTLGETKDQMQFAEHTGKINAVLQLSLGISALLGGLIAGISFVWVFWLSVIPQVLALVVSFQIKEPQVVAREKSSNILADLQQAFTLFKTNSKLRHLSLASILGFGMGEVQNQFMPAFISTVWPVWSLGVSKAINKLVSILGSRNAGAILRSFPAFKVLFLGQIFGIVLVLVAIIFPTVFSPILIGITSLQFGVTGVALTSLLHAEFSDKQRATMGSINSFFSNIFFAIFAYIFGTIADHFGVHGPVIMTQLLMLSVVYIYWSLFRSNKTAHT